MRRTVVLGCVALVAAMGACGGADDNTRPVKDVAGGSVTQSLLSQGVPDTTKRAYFVRLQGPSAVGALLVGQTVHGASGKAAIARRLDELKKSHATLGPMLEAHGATIIGDFRKVVNAFQVVTTAAGAERLAELPGVVEVERSPIYYPSLSTGLAAVQAPQAWDSGVGSFTGQGIRMGIIDSGIDYLHADFGGSGNPDDYLNNDSAIIEPGTFPTVRVVGGFDFVGDDYTGANNPIPDPDPLDCRTGDAAQHGTHVAGIAGGNGVLTDGTAFSGPYNASFDPSIFGVAPGVAPETDLYALKVFGCSGGTTLLVQAFEWAVDPNNDNDLSDRLDVVNMSLGSTFSLTTSGTTQTAAGNLHQAGTLLVAAAGNEGDTTFAHGFPGSLPEVLSVGASFAVSSAQLQVSAPASVAGDYDGVEAAFSPPLSPTGIGGEIVATEPAVACSSINNAAAIAGKIALIQRGSCSFLQKFGEAETAGAIAVVMVNNEPGLFTMGGNGSSPLPGLMITQADGAALLAAMSQDTVTGTLLLPPFSLDDESFADFLSSRGPSVLDGALKPDISAPGVSVVSANGGSGIGGVANTGTSMATPFVAGAAAVVRQAFSSLEPQDVKALMMGASQPLRSSASQVMPIAYQGSGRLALADILAQTAFLRSQDEPDAVSLSFGHIESLEPVVRVKTANIVNLSDAAITYDLTINRVHPLAGVTITVEPTSITVPAQSTSETITVEIAVDPVALGDPAPDPVTGVLTAVFDGEGGQIPAPRAHLNEADGWLVASVGAAEAARLPFFGSVRAVANRRAAPGPHCTTDGDDIIVPISGTSSHPTPVVTAFQLGAVDDLDVALPPRIDLRAVGAATNLGVFGGAFADAEVYFGVAVEGTWRTAAIPEVPLVSIEIDLDADEELDYLLVPEPNSRTSFAFADFLVARSYIIDGCNALNLGSCERTPYEERLQLNLVPADELDTAPYFNGVLVLPALTRNIGLTEATPSFHYRARTLTPNSDIDATAWASFDVTAPAVDPAAPAPTAGTPLYTGDQEVRVRVAPTADERRMLLLHHHNPERMTGADGEELSRFEVVDLPRVFTGPLSLTAPSSATTGDTIALAASWTNPSQDTLTDVALAFSTTAGSTVSATSANASCNGAECIVAALGPGETIDVTAQLSVSTPGDNQVSAEISSAGGCPISASSTLSVASPDDGRLVATGGCGCRIANVAPGSSPRAVWLLGLAGLALLRRRRLGSPRSR